MYMILVNYKNNFTCRSNMQDTNTCTCTCIQDTMYISHTSFGDSMDGVGGLGTIFSTFSNSLRDLSPTATVNRIIIIIIIIKQQQ